MPDELEGQLVLSWEDYRAIAVRRRWWVLLPLFVCWAAAWGTSWQLPRTYRSEALILVDQQKVPDQYVVPNATVNLQDRLESLTQQILSRTLLEQIIEHHHLYSRRLGIRGIWRRKNPVEQIREDIEMELVETPAHPGEYAAFKIGYSAESPQLAQEVSAELTSLFVNESVRAQEQLSENTTAFLEDQLTQARAKMAEQEANVAAFKAKRMGDLPSQLDSNVQIISGLHAQILNTQQALDAARQQKLYWESLLRGNESAQGRQRDGELEAASRQAIGKELLELRLRLGDLRSHYTDDHPDIVALKDKIATSEKMQKGIEDEDSPNRAGSNAVTPAEPARENAPLGAPTAAMQIESQLKANELEIQNFERREDSLESQVAMFQARLNRTPKTEQELAEISRGYEESKSNYNSLLQKQMQAQLATNLEQNRQGRQFRVVDPPSLPDKPSTPNHFRLSVVGVAAGMVLGLALAGFVEMTDAHVRRERDLEGLIPACVVVHIPRLSTARENTHRKVAWWLEACAAVAVFSLMVAGNLYAWYRG
jgi:polysaccharide chain length determinant protein (PEP-CTERM system associated)